MLWQIMTDGRNSHVISQCDAIAKSLWSELNGHKSNVKALIPVWPNIYNLFLGQVIEQMDKIFREMVWVNYGDPTWH